MSDQPGRTLSLGDRVTWRQANPAIPDRVNLPAEGRVPS